MPHSHLISDSLPHSCMPFSRHLTQAHASRSLNQWISLSFFFPSHPHSIWTSILPLLRICLTIFFFLFTFSPSRRLDLGLALCALLSTSRLHQVLILFFWFLFWLLDSLSFIWSFSWCFFFIFYFLLHLRFSVHVLGFISGSPFHDFTGKW